MEQQCLGILRRDRLLFPQEPLKLIKYAIEINSYPGEFTINRINCCPLVDEASCHRLLEIVAMFPCSAQCQYLIHNICHV